MAALRPAGANVTVHAVGVATNITIGTRRAVKITGVAALRLAMFDALTHRPALVPTVVVTVIGAVTRAIFPFVTVVVLAMHEEQRQRRNQQTVHPHELQPRNHGATLHHCERVVSTASTGKNRAGVAAPTCDRRRHPATTGSASTSRGST